MNPVCNGATLLCSCGTAPAVMTISNKGISHRGQMQQGTVADCVPLVNIPPFGNCTAPANPHPPLGVVRPCVPSFSSQWSSEAPGITVHKFAVLDSSATLNCTYGGVVRVTDPGQTITRHTPPSLIKATEAARRRDV